MPFIYYFYFRRRYYCGLKETCKQMNKMSLIIIPPSIKRGKGPGKLSKNTIFIDYSEISYKLQIFYVIIRDINAFTLELPDRHVK